MYVLAYVCAYFDGCKNIINLSLSLFLSFSLSLFSLLSSLFLSFSLSLFLSFSLLSSLFLLLSLSVFLFSFSLFYSSFDAWADAKKILNVLIRSYITHPRMIIYYFFYIF